MLKDLSADHIYIVFGHTDMRKSIDGLAAIIQQQYQLDLFSNSAFLFCGRRRNRMKILLWEDSGNSEIGLISKVDTSVNSKIVARSNTILKCFQSS